MVGAVVLLLSLITKYPLGLVKVLPFTVHSAGDYLAAVLLLASPFALGFWFSARGLSIVYLVAGVAVAGVSLITNYQWSPKRQPGRRPASDRSERPTYASPRQPSYAPQGAAPAAAERAVSLRDAIAQSRQAS